MGGRVCFVLNLKVGNGLEKNEKIEAFIQGGLEDKNELLVEEAGKLIS